jgi:hypothetical protein
MKCVKSTDGAIKRIHDKEADEKVKTGQWVYIPKSEYKKATRTFVDLNAPKIEASSEKEKKDKKNTK